jgi:hypothetical protein
MIELIKLREERLLHEKREREKKIKYEEDQRAERLRLEQIELQKIRNEPEKEMELITKYNEKNPSFEYGVRYQTGDCNGNQYFMFSKPTGTSINKYSAPDKHKFIFDISLISSIKNDKTFLINYKKLVKDYEWINKYINGETPFMEFIFDEIIPNIDTIIDEISVNLKYWEDWLDRNIKSMAHHSAISASRSAVAYINSTLSQYTTLKRVIPSLKSKEYYIVNQSEFIVKPYGDLNEDTKCPMWNVRKIKYHSLYLTWVKNKIAIMDSFVTSINAIIINKDGFLFNIPSHNPNGLMHYTIYILESYKEYVFWNTHIQHLTDRDQRPHDMMTKDYTFNYFEPLMLLAKNIIDLTEEIKPEYCVL